MWESWQTCPWARGAAVVAAYADLIDVVVAVVAAKGLRVEKQPWLPLLGVEGELSKKEVES